MKPPLQTYDKHPDADAYRVGGFYSPYCLVSEDKRFRPGEIAAEYWRKSGEYDLCTDGYSTAGDGYIFEYEDVEAARLATLRRFATLPHFDEEPA